MLHKFTLVLLALFILTGCSGSQSIKKDAITKPYKFIQPIKTEIYEESEKGGNEDAFLEDESFTPHPLIPLEEISNVKSKSKSNNLSYTGLMHDLGIEIDPKKNERFSPNNISVVDPMLESIRQDLMVKWGIDEPVIQPKNREVKTISDIESKVLKMENSIKGDLAALRSENLMLVSRLQEIEKRINSGLIQTKKPKKHVNVKKSNKPIIVIKQSSQTKQSYKDRYDSALAEYRLKKFRSAIKNFNALIKVDNKHSLSDNAQYWIGECYYHLGAYSKASSEFKKVLAYDISNKKDSAILMNGKALKHLGLKNDALQQFKSLIALYPRSSYTKRARELISNLEKG